jgi:hypothetical protein
MGGIILPPPTTFAPPVLWRLTFPAEVQAKLATAQTPSGTITNSDLELAATIIQHDVICQLYDMRERTIHTSTDNRAAQAWQMRKSTTTDSAPAFLLRLQAIHQRHHRYVTLHSYLPGQLNAMADDASRLWQLTDQQLLTHFDTVYPQHQSWHIFRPRPAMHSAVISALHKKRSAPASFLNAPKQQTPIGAIGWTSARHCKLIPFSKTLRTPSYSSKSIYSDTAQEKLRPVASLSDLVLWKTPSVPLARHLHHWGPATHVATSTATLTSASNANYAATHDWIHHPTE